MSNVLDSEPPELNLFFNCQPSQFSQLVSLSYIIQDASP